MATEIIMPRFGMTQEEATVVQWLVEEGASVEKGDPIMEVETDKVTMEVEAPETGIVGGLRVAAGDVVPVTDVIGYVLQEGETAPEYDKGASTARRASAERKPQATPVARRVAAEAGIEVERVAAAEGGRKVWRQDVERYLQGDGEIGEDGSERVRATPAARRVAREHELDLARVRGSGPRGRVQEADALAFAAQQMETAGHEESGPAVFEVRPLRGMRRTIAERMQQSYQTAPHITFTVEAEVSAAQALRRRLNERAAAEQKPPLSVTAVLVKVCAWALQRHRLLNAALLGDEIVLYEPSNVGVAVALEEGLIVPVVHHAERLGLAAIAARLQEVTERARQGTLTAQDVGGGTFTISNLGMLGVDQFTAIINPPQSAILAVGRIVKRQLVIDGEHGEAVAIRPMMQMTLSADHRVLDGAVAARFLQDVVAALADPGFLLW